MEGSFSVGMKASWLALVTALVGIAVVATAEVINTFEYKNDQRYFNVHATFENVTLNVDPNAKVDLDYLRKLFENSGKIVVEAAPQNPPKTSEEHHLS